MDGLSIIDSKIIKGSMAIYSDVSLHLRAPTHGGVLVWLATDMHDTQYSLTSNSESSSMTTVNAQQPEYHHKMPSARTMDVGSMVSCRSSVLSNKGSSHFVLCKYLGKCKLSALPQVLFPL